MDLKGKMSNHFEIKRQEYYINQIYSLGLFKEVGGKYRMMDSIFFEFQYDRILLEISEKIVAHNVELENLFQPIPLRDSLFLVQHRGAVYLAKLVLGGKNSEIELKQEKITCAPPIDTLTKMSDTSFCVHDRHVANATSFLCSETERKQK